jgi:hypothetical protein
MNALLRKEIRLLLPVWVAAVGLTLVPALLSPLVLVPRVAVLLAGSAALAFLLSLGAFGREFAHGTFPSLLALPVPRARLWWTKVAVLFAALLSLYAMWWLSFSICAARWPALWRFAADGELTPISTALFLVVVFSGGLWTTIFFRQVSAAIWFALLLPLLLTTAAGAITDRFTAEPGAHAIVLSTVALVYGVGGFLLAWRLFLRAEEAHWTGGTLSFSLAPLLPRRHSAQRGLRQSQRRSRRPFVALCRKELGLHRGAVGVMASLLLLLHLGVVALRHAQPALATQPLLGTIFTLFWAIWLFLPFLMGATAVAEERKLGILEFQLGQPIHWLRQWIAKVGVAGLLGLLCGTLPPCLLEDAAQLPNFFGTPPIAGFEIYGAWITMAVISGIALVVGIYASSLSRNTFQALGMGAAALALGSLLVAFLGDPQNFISTALWRGDIGLTLGLPVLIGLPFLLASTNFRRVTVTGRDWRRNALILTLGALTVVASASAIYHRAWEVFLDQDPAHGAARLDRQENVMLRHDGVLGSLGPAGELRVYLPVFRPTASFLWKLGIGPVDWQTHRHGSNWSRFVCEYFETAALRTDGTVWQSEWPRSFMISSSDPPVTSPPLIQGPPGTNWQQIARDPFASRSFLLLRDDGTLWQWKFTNIGPYAMTARLPFNAAPELRPIATNAHWSSMQSSGPRVYLTRSDGQTWVVNHFYRTSTSQKLDLGPNASWEYAGALDGIRWRSLTATTTYDLAVREDGTLWAIGLLPWSRQRYLEQIGDASDWQSVAANYQSGIGLNADGSVWRFNFGTSRERPTMSRLSRQNDWRAVASFHDAIFAAAADGSIWRWDSYGYRNVRVEIASSRIPIRVGSLMD